LDLGPGKVLETKTIEDPNTAKAASNEVYAATTPEVINPFDKKPVELKGRYDKLKSVIYRRSQEENWYIVKSHIATG
jgi:hypothetical protein